MKSKRICEARQQKTRNPKKNSGQMTRDSFEMRKMPSEDELNKTRIVLE